MMQQEYQQKSNLQHNYHRYQHSLNFKPIWDQFQVHHVQLISVFYD